MKNAILFFSFALLIGSCSAKMIRRQIINLNGTWEIAKTDSMTSIPTEFKSKIEVPGLVDMSRPKTDSQDSLYINSVYWYKRSFSVEDLTVPVVQLKINKSAYHTWVYVNKKLVGENVYNFTPSLFDLKPFLNSVSKENELIIAVGCRNNLPDTVVNGNDFEKIKYTPGIYDDVKLILSGYPFISNVQAVPDIVNENLRIVAEIKSNPGTTGMDVSYIVRETVSKEEITHGSVKQVVKSGTTLRNIDFSVKMAGCKLWTPEDPFLYDLELSTSGDNSKTRFGMRTFAVSRDSAVFLLNNKPYFLRGTNVCIFRFFEDPERENLPWNSKWINKLNSRFKEMNWNSIRYCIGFPPEKWYEAADSLGLLIQDEFPIWTSLKGGFEKFQKGITSKQLAAEYRDWMRERWNHPCVVMWDGQNESVTDTTGKAIKLVRALDLSNRPWDNGYAPPVSESDAIEAHPYLFSQYLGGKNPSNEGYLKDLFSTIRIPHNDPNEMSPAPNGKRYQNPAIINEYSWLWLNRDGTTTTLTDRVYRIAFPEAITPDQKFEAYAKNTAILTEYWRAYRKCAGLMHFCGLGYSRTGKPRGQTSDNFTDIKLLTYEPHFVNYVKPAFNPVGLMIELWGKSYVPSSEISVPVHVFNDIEEEWKGSLKLSVFSEGKNLLVQNTQIILRKYEVKVIRFKIKMPQVKGKYQMEAEISYKGESVKSYRDLKIE
jgi:hypothetical protein